MTPFLATVLALGGLAAAQSLMGGMVNLSADFLLLTVFACIAVPHTLNLGHNARISTLSRSYWRRSCCSASRRRYSWRSSA